MASWRDSTGRRMTRYGQTRAAASDLLIDGLGARADGVVTPAGGQTVEEFLTLWLEDSAKRSVRPLTFMSYKTIVSIDLIPELGPLLLAQLTPQHVQRLMNRKLDGGLSPRRVQYVRAVLRLALRAAEQWGYVSRNVASLTTPPKAAPHEIRPLDPDRIRIFLEHIRGHRLEALYTVALAIGLRQGEALGLRWEDVDLDTATLHVRHGLQRLDGKLTLVAPKTQRSRRTVMLPAVAVKSLRAHRERQAHERVLAAQLWREADFVFTTPLGGPLDGNNVTHAFQRVLKSADLPHQRFHDLRHACASLLLVQGVSPRVVMEVLGHSQVTLTLNTYSHVMPSLQREAADQMDAALGGGG